MKMRRVAAAAAFVFASTAAAAPSSVTTVSPGACTSAQMTPDLASPQAVNTVTPVVINFTASATTCATPEYRFLLQKPSGSFIAQTAYGAATWKWDTTGLTGGVYGIEVLARQTGSTASYEAYWIGTYTLSVLTCTAAGISSPGPAGSIYQIFGSGTRCPNAEVRFWLKPPGGAWRMVRDYQPVTPGNPWNWNITGVPNGIYQVGVWARQQGSPNRYDAYYIQTVQLGPILCQGASIGPVQPPPVAPGTVVQFNASASCPGLYAYWLKAPGKDWLLVLPYTTASEVIWKTHGFAQGTYQIGVWTRPVKWAHRYAAYAITTMVLGVTPCSGVAITAGSVSPQVPGLPITFTATAAATSPDCTAPTYEFWLLPSAATGWVIAQHYGTGTTYTLDTTGAPAGPIRVGVWIRETGSANRYDSYAILTFWLGS